MRVPKRMSENVTFMLSNTSSASQIFLDKQMEELGLTRSQWLCLSLLYFVEGCNQKELADLMDIGKGALGKLAAKLEDRNWIYRRSTSEDGRAITLYLRDDARPIVKLLVELLFEETKRSLTGLSSEEVNIMRDLMRRMHHNVDTAPLSQRWLTIKSEVTLKIKGLNGRNLNN